jgi:hypothetical protein
MAARCVSAVCWLFRAMGNGHCRPGLDGVRACVSVQRIQEARWVSLIKDGCVMSMHGGGREAKLECGKVTAPCSRF